MIRDYDGPDEEDGEWATGWNERVGITSQAYSSSGNCSMAY